MDILIKNVEKPKNCLECQFYTSEYDYCHVLKDNLSQKEWETKRRCPIVELPPHEHLTEKSAFWNMLHEICVKCNDSGDINRYPHRCVWCKIKEAYEKVYQTPTVLEAST